MDRPGNYDFYKGARSGGNQSKGALECEEWLKKQHCPAPRTKGAIQRKACLLYPFGLLMTPYQINLLQKKWRRAVDFRDRTGNGGGTRRIEDAEEEDREQVIQDVQGMSFCLC